jgi:hypothetical protein
MPSVFAFQDSIRFIKRMENSIPKNSKVFYLLGNAGNDDFPPLAKKKGWKPVDLDIGKCWPQEKILEEYMELIASFSQWNAGTLHWWATYLSSKNRLNSPVLPNLNELHRSLSAIENLKSDEYLVLLNISWPAVKALKSIASQKKYQFKIYSPFFSKFKDLGKAKYIFWRNFLAEVIFSFFSIWKARRVFGKNHNINTKKPIYLIKSFTYLKNFKKNGYDDPFFGQLPNYLKESIPDVTILTLALGFQDRIECYKKMKKLNNSLVHPIEIYLNYWDVLIRGLEWLWRLSFHPFKIKGKIFWLGHDITPFFQELISFGGFRFSFFQSLHYDMANRVGSQFKIKMCFMTYEGIPWERFFIDGLRKANKDTIIVGCQHTVIPLSAADMFLHQREKGIIPLPDKILTTGKIPKNILEKYGSYPKEQIKTGCALRFESLQNLSLLKCREESKRNFVLLVAFGGSEEEIPLLNYSLGQASLNKDVIFRMRTHPTFSWDKLMLLRKSDLKLPENVLISTSSEVLDDLKSCDAVLYWGTTVALESLMVGKPIINFDREDLLNYDPLFEFTDFKWQVQQKDPLQNIIQDIQKMPETSYQKHQEQGKKYIKEFFYPVTKQNLEKFF